MAKYRKKPVVIEATQWFKNGDHPLDYNTAEEQRIGYEGQVVRYFRHPKYQSNLNCEHCRDVFYNHGWVDTLEGGHIVCPGDWIITGVKGEHYPCKPDIFEMTYEEITNG
jgi:hypothetical protein